MAVTEQFTTVWFAVNVCPLMDLNRTTLPKRLFAGLLSLKSWEIKPTFSRSPTADQSPNEPLGVSVHTGAGPANAAGKVQSN